MEETVFKALSTGSIDWEATAIRRPSMLLQLAEQMDQA
jgi:hypothetical protein